MSGPRRDLASFARTVEALRPYLGDLVFVGGWAHFLYTVLPEAVPLGFEPLFTEDADIAAPLGLPIRKKPIPELLAAAGFKQHLSGDHQPPIAEYALGEEDSGFYVEFLAPLLGGELKRSGQPDVTTSVGGVSAQKLRHLDVLLIEPLTVKISKPMGFPVSRTTRIRIPNPASYIAQKVLTLSKRHPSRAPKDVLYDHDTLATFADSLSTVRKAWARVQAHMIPAHVSAFEKKAGSLVAGENDLVRGAVRIAAEREDAPSPQRMLAALRLGLTEAFGLDVSAPHR